MSVTAAMIMSTGVVSIKPGASILDAIKSLTENKISGLPVVDAEQKVIGIVSEKDILGYASQLHVVPLRGSSGWVSPYTDVSQLVRVKEGYDLLSREKVEKIMSKKVVIIHESTPLGEIASLMKKKNIHRIPVVNDAGKLSGIVTRADLLTYLAEEKTTEKVT